MNLTEEQIVLFQKLESKRLNSYKTYEEDEILDTLIELITNIYSENAHFILELFQNADDTFATHIDIELYDDRLIFIHNGTQRFNLTDVDYDKINKDSRGDINAITLIGKSTKINESQKIGKFGIGFKSVFKDCETIEVYDNPFCFKIEKIMIPTLIDDPKYKIYDNKTTFILYFKSELKENIKENILLKLQEIQNYLYFLNNIIEVNWKCKEITGFYLKKINMDNNTISFIYEERLNNINVKTVVNEFLYYQNNYTYNSKDLKCIILFPCNEEFITQYPLNCFFPLRGETLSLNLLIHAPFMLTPTREKIDTKDENYELNQNLYKTTSDIFIDILIDLKSKNQCTYKELLQLPIYQNVENTIYKVFFNKMQTIFLDFDNYFIPTNEPNIYLNQTESVIGNNNIIELFSKDDLKMIFPKQDYNWVDKSIKNSGETQPLYNFLVDHVKIKTINIMEILEKFDDKILKYKNNKWLMKFYKLLSDQGNYINSEKDKLKNNTSFFQKYKIIRLNNGEFVTPYKENGELNCYLPSDFDTDVNILDYEFYENKDSLEFFSQIGIREFNILEEVLKNIIPIYEKTHPTISKEDNFEHNQKIVQVLDSKLSPNEKKELVKLEDLPIIRAYNKKLEDYSFCKPNDVFLSEKFTGNRVIETFFEDIEDYDYYLIDDKMTDYSNLKTLKELGCKDKIDLFNECKTRIIEKYYLNNLFDFNKLSTSVHLKHIHYCKEYSYKSSMKFKNINKKGKVEWKYGLNSYFRNEELEILLGKEFCFIDEELYNENREDLIKIFNINENIKIKYNKDILLYHSSSYVNIVYNHYVQSNKEERYWVNKYVRSKGKFDPFAEIDNFDFIVKNFTSIKFKLLWSLISEKNFLIKGLVQKSNNQQFNGAELKDEYSILGQKLIATSWIPHKNGEFRKPSDINLFDILDDLIDKNSHETKLLCDKLGIKYSNISQEEALKTLNLNEEDLQIFKDLELLSESDKNEIAVNIKLKKEQLAIRTEIFKQIEMNDKGKRTMVVQENYLMSEPKTYDYKDIKTRTSKPSKKNADKYLTEFYGNKENLFCQICDQNMYFKYDGEYYFESVEMFNIDNIKNETEEVYLCLCPVCSEQYKLIKKNFDNLSKIKNKILEIDINNEKSEYIINLDFETNLLPSPSKISFVRVHILDIQNILEVEEENNIE